MNKINLTVKYDSGHSYDEVWELVENMYCSHCGTQNSVWSETGEGDYYAGNQYICTECGASANEAYMYPSDKYYDHQRLEQLRSKI